jgi:nitrite reductase/ring-hydroxylating ferredoxin subunit
MKSPFYFIVESLINKRYNNTKTISGLEVITSTSEEDYISSNRFAKVIEVPLGYKGPISSGDTLLVHHNVFKYYYDMKGNQKSGKSFFKDDIFLIDNEQFFLYKKDDTWHAYDKYCFVKPIPATESYISKPFSKEPLMGIMKYPNEYLMSQGVNAGDSVVFSPNSEYEFDVDGEKLYRIYDHQITIKL